MVVPQLRHGSPARARRGPRSTCASTCLPSANRSGRRWPSSRIEAWSAHGNFTRSAWNGFDGGCRLPRPSRRPRVHGSGVDRNVAIKKKAQQLVQKGQIDAALAEFDKLFAQGDKDPYDFIMVADLLAKRGSMQEAVRRYRQAA